METEETEKKDEEEKKPEPATDEKEESKTEDDSKEEEEAPVEKETKSTKVDGKKKAAKSKEEPSLASTRPRRASKRRVQLPMNGSPPSKVAKKGSEDIVDSTNDAVRGLHLLSQATQAVARDKKRQVERV